ncbi:MAG: allophanate hydrolase, partial [Actinomycetota bacterium]|nr:allophanate hydrolase [Actinomycetota bacterium]
MPIEVTKPGLATTVQDRGREGYYHVGVPPSGALDQFSLVAANLLVGNPADAAALECAFMGPELRFTESTVVAATGAELELQLNGEAQPGWTSLAVAPGDVLTFGYIKRGARMCLAVAGGIDVPEVLGSRATYVLGGLGGHEGRALQAGDELAIGGARDEAVGRSVPEDLRPELPNELEIRVVMGLYDHLLTDEGRET